MESEAELAPGAGAADGSAPVMVENAGLVLTSPFFPHLFERLGVTMLGEDGRPRIADAQAPRAVNLLQYLATGSTFAPDARLELNKVLCGIEPSRQLTEPAPLTAHETATCDQLLATLIANWPALGSTSPEALRETFLQRPGRLERSGDAYGLKVQRKSLDVLLDQVPWSISVVMNRWMPQPLRVTW